jgi:RNA polymerase sigma factor (sigma-70 family)
LSTHSQLFETESALSDDLWSSLLAEVEGFARRQLKTIPQSVIDEQDIASSVFASLWRGFQAGRLPSIVDQDECLRILRTIARRKIVDRLRYLNRAKRQGRTVSLVSSEIAEGTSDMNPEIVLILTELVEKSLECLNPSLRPIVGLRLQGYDHAEIASLLGVSKNTVSRKLAIVREKWSVYFD